jgi:purine-binding chemotaxis protein CheW
VIPIPGLKENKRKGCLNGVVTAGESRNVFLVDAKALCSEPDIRESIEASSVPDAFYGAAGGTTLGQGTKSGERDELKVYITFKLGKVLAADITEVEEIIAFPSDLMEPPGYQGHIRGMLSLRGSIIPIVDMRRYYGMEDYDSVAEASVLVVAYHDARYGLIVDTVEDSVDVYTSQTTVIPKVMNDSSNAEFRGDVSRILEYTRLDGKTDTLMVFSVESFLQQLAEEVVLA